MVRRLAFAALLAGALACAAPAHALCPGNTVRFLVPFPGSGSSADGLARAVSARLAQMWGRNVIVDNRPGAGGVAATQIIASSAPDGCTMGMVTPAIAANPALMKNRLPYDTLKDLTMLGVMVDVPVGLFSHPSLPAKTVAELVAHAKSQPQGLAYGTPGVGTGSHLAGELFAHRAGVKLVHVPYKGAAPAELDLLAGRVQLMFAAVSSEVQQVQAGKLRLIAVTGDKRVAAFPDVPTVGESIPGYRMGSYFGVVGPGGMDKALAQRVSRDLADALRSPEVKQQLDARGLVAVGSSPQEFERMVRAEMQEMARLVEATGLSVD